MNPIPSAFSRWAAAFSQRTNRSIAGTRLTASQWYASTPSWQDFSTEAKQWGMIVTDPLPEPAPITYEPVDIDKTVVDCCLPMKYIQDARGMDGKEAMDYAQKHMPVMQAMLKKISKDQRLKNLRIAVCLVLEPKTAVLLRCLKATGAKVGVYCGPEDTDPRVVEQLRREGVLVEANPEWNAEQSHEGALRLLDALDPQIIIDDGGSFARLAAKERPELAQGLLGVAEETTSGIRAFVKMEQAGALPFPVVASNNSPLKTDFDNRHGTGETCVTTMQDALGVGVFSESKVAVVGYGPVGKGFAERIRAIGAYVTVCEADPVVALQAVFDGYDAQDITTAIKDADMVVSATGERHTITLEHLRAMKEGAVVGVIGGVANEIALDEIDGFTRKVGEKSRQLKVPDGPTLTLVANGDGVNYTIGGGNPISIMDLSFAVQVSALDYLLREGKALGKHVVELPESYNREIATEALSVRGASASPRAEQPAAWELTRFDE